MDMFAYIRYLCNNMQGLIAHILRMWSRKTHTQGWNLLGNTTQQLRETYLFKTIAVDILPQQGDLFKSSVTQVTYLAEDAFHITATLASPSVRNNTIMAEIVTATHDADKATNLGAMQALRYDIPIGLAGWQFNIDGLMACLSLGYQIG